MVPSVLGHEGREAGHVQDLPARLPPQLHIRRGGPGPGRRRRRRRVGVPVLRQQGVEVHRVPGLRPHHGRRRGLVREHRFGEEGEGEQVPRREDAGRRVRRGRRRGSDGKRRRRQPPPGHAVLRGELPRVLPPQVPSEGVPEGGQELQVQRARVRPLRQRPHGEAVEGQPGAPEEMRRMHHLVPHAALRAAGRRPAVRLLHGLLGAQGQIRIHRKGRPGEANRQRLHRAPGPPN
mmetsp:Transcript_30678/g.74748  ORF Transcript_30678/g.74748 Transcript_30678/m.74748 type:complete len:234 (+) Transcript_30678:498-1199(+)